MKKPLPPTFFLSALGLSAALHILCPGCRVLTMPWRLSGLIPLLAGIALNIVADQNFKLRCTTVKPFEESNAFITAGIFHVTRNPMYLGMVLIVLGVDLLLGSATPFVAAVALAILLDRLFIVREEQMLEATFGDEFRQYRQQVRRWI